MSHRVLSVLVLISLSMSGYSVWKHLHKDPEETAKLVMQGMQKLHVKAEEEKQQQQLERIKEKAEELNKDQSSPITGNPEGDVTMTYFFDYRCGYCRRGDPTIQELLKEEPNLKVVYKEYPIFKNIIPASAALAAHKQGRYIDMHRALMAHEGDFTEDAVLKIASGLKLHMKQLKEDMASQEVKDIIKRNHALAKVLDISGTPVYVVGATTIIPGTVGVDEFREAIKAVREEQGTDKKESAPNAPSSSDKD